MHILSCIGLTQNEIYNKSTVVVLTTDRHVDKDRIKTIKLLIFNSLVTCRTSLMRGHNPIQVTKRVLWRRKKIQYSKLKRIKTNYEVRWRNEPWKALICQIQILDKERGRNKHCLVVRAHCFGITWHFVWSLGKNHRSAAAVSNITLKALVSPESPNWGSNAEIPFPWSHRTRVPSARTGQLCAGRLQQHWRPWRDAFSLWTLKWLKPALCCYASQKTRELYWPIGAHVMLLPC